MHQTQEGRRFASFTLATAERWKDERGINHQRTHYHRVVVYNEPLADLAEKALRKGTRVFVAGKLRNTEWVDPEGHEHRATEVALTVRGGELAIFSPKRRTSDAAPDQPEASQGSPAPDERTQ